MNIHERIPFGGLADIKQAKISRDMVIDKFTYCPDSGEFINNRSGKAAISKSDGYIIIMVSGLSFVAHRVAWFINYGTWPTGVIDHINHDRSDNRIINLRDVSPTENARNKVKRGHSK